MLTKMDTFVFIIMSLIVIGTLTEGRPKPRSSRSSTTGIKEDKYVYGLPKEDADVVQELVYKIKKEIAEENGHNISMAEKYNPKIQGDIVVTRSEAEEIYEEVLKNKANRNLNNQGQPRAKRHSVDFKKFDWARWPNPIRYYIQEAPLSNFTNEDKQKIRNAFKRWEEYTCLRFEEDPGYEGNRLRITGHKTGCWSFIGRKRDLVEQTINLQTPECTILTGVAMHEIGHAIGLYHMEDSPDRDKYIAIIKKNIAEGLEANLEPVSKKSVRKYGLPWDRASLMQFRRDSYSQDGAYTILQKDPQYFYTAGMVEDISFLDLTLVNKGYNCDVHCEGIISNSGAVAPECKNGGYPDPGVRSQCTSCRCPAGLSGDCKETPAPSSNGCYPNNNAVIEVTEEEDFLESPGFSNGHMYSINDTCSWVLKSPKDTSIEFYFDDSFGVYHIDVSGGLCHHYVEIKFNGNFKEPGKRHCGSENHVYNQKETLLTYTNKAVVHFNGLSPDLLDMNPKKFVGFRLYYKATKDMGKPCKKINLETGKCKTNGNSKKNKKK